MGNSTCSRRSFLKVSSWLAGTTLGFSSLGAGRVSGGLRLPEDQFLADVRSHLEDLDAEDAFSGAVLIARRGAILLGEAYGYAERAYNFRNRIDTKFNLGSLGKMFTAVSILQLAEAGRLSLDDELIKVLPDYPDREIASEITIYDLLTHTSGLGDIFTRKFWDTPKDRFDTLRAYVPIITGKPLLFKPGSRWSYSNAGFIVLGLVIQEVSGTDYFEYVRDHVFKRAGMIDTDNYKLYQDVPNMAVGYTMPAIAALTPVTTFPGDMSVPPRIKNSDFLQPGTSAGGGYSTVEDLLRFSQALQGHELLSERYSNLALTGKVATGLGTMKCGLGMMEDYINGVRIVGHRGGAPGISSNLDMYPGLGYTVAVMTNFDDAAILANERIRMRLADEAVARTITLPRAALAAFSGMYSPTMAEPSPAHDGAVQLPSMKITADSTGLWLVALMRYRLLPGSATEFLNDNAPYIRIIFEKNERGAVSGFDMWDSRSNRKLMSAAKMP